MAVLRRCQRVVALQQLGQHEEAMASYKTLLKTVKSVPSRRSQLCRVLHCAIVAAGVTRP